MATDDAGVGRVPTEGRPIFRRLYLTWNGQKLSLSGDLNELVRGEWVGSVRFRIVETCMIVHMLIVSCCGTWEGTGWYALGSQEYTFVLLFSGSRQTRDLNIHACLGSEE